MAQFPALPLFTDAYLGDTTHLTTIEHGTYLLLLMAAWRSKDCKLPDDDKLLARYAKLSPAQWKKLRPFIIPFFTIENGFLFQGRLRDELTFVKQKSKSQSDKAKARWLKTNNTADAVASLGQSKSTTPTPTPTPTPIKNIINGVHFDQIWEPWIKKQGKKEALARFQKSVTTVDHFTKVLDGAKKYITFHKNENTPVNMTLGLAPWLNGERWTDELPTTKTNYSNTPNVRR